MATRNLRILLLAFLLPAIVWGQKPTSAAKPIVLGHAETLQSTHLKEQRILNIYLPEGYTADDTSHYPVIYLLDGGVDEDFVHIAGLVQFCALPWVDYVGPSIVVGIANVDRKRDFTFPTTVAADKAAYPTTGGSAAFISFLVDEVQPWVAKRYRVRGPKTLVGQSLGGLVGTEILFTRPDAFEKYVLISPSLWWDNGSLLKRKPAVLGEAWTRPTSVYVGVGKEGLAPTEVPHVMEVDANVLAEMLAAAKGRALKSYFDYLPAENHGTITHQAVLNALRWLGK